MSEALVVAGLAAFVIVILSAVVSSLLKSNKALTRALIANNSHDMVLLDQSAARAEPKQSLWPTRQPQATPYDNDEPVPLGLGG